MKYERSLAHARGTMSEGIWPPERISLTPGKRVLFLTKDLELIRSQLYEGLDLRMEDLSVDDLLGCASITTLQR